ncbi:MAG: exosortase/archaeosortase family protein [Lentisphaeria bacterium]|jgi:exosortase
MDNKPTATVQKPSLFHLPVIAVALLIGTIQGLRCASGHWENTFIIAAIAALMAWDSRYRMSPLRPKVPPQERLLAWLALALASCFLFIPGEAVLDLNANIMVLLLAFALCAFERGARTALWSLPPLLLALVVMPLQEHIYLSFSYVLRLLSTILCCETLQLFNADLSYHHTTIYVNNASIAITDACSGISQLFALFLLGYLIVRWQHRQLRHALLHYSLLLPIVVLANALRLIITVVLFAKIGEAIFADFFHILFGLLLVVVTVTLMYAAGKLFLDREPLPADATAPPLPLEPFHDAR